MLVLSRKIGERILIEPGIEIGVLDVRGGKVRIGIVAPESVRIRRDELAICPQLDLPAERDRRRIVAQLPAR